jgi:hypothetical protein
MITKKSISLYFLSRTSVYLSGIFLLINTFLNGKIDVLLLTAVFLIVSIFLLELILLSMNITLVSFFFVALFCIGFYLKLGLIFYDPNIFGYSGFTTLGNFSFQFNDFLNLYLVIIISTLGILCGIRLALIGVSKECNLQTFKYFEKDQIKKNYAIFLILIWFICSLGLMSFMDYFKIGIHGLSNQTEFPKFIAGLLNFLRGFYVFSIGFCIYDILIKNCSKSLKLFYFIIFLSLVAIAATKFTLNRSAALFPIIPFLILLMCDNKNYFSKNIYKINFKTFFYSFLFLIFISLASEFANQKRALLYSNLIVDLNFYNFLNSFIEFVVIRVEGIRELMLVVDYPNKGIESYIELMLGIFSAADELYNFSLEGTAFGVTVGFQGQSFLSGSYFLSFVHSFIFFFILTKIEIFFKLRGLFVFSIYISFLLVSLVWMNVDFYTVIRIFFILFLINFTVISIRKLFVITRFSK